VASSVTFMIPLFSMLWAKIFLAEPFTAGMFLGLAIILTSVALVLEL
jgi:drug/metabolite transporter (DMT)-like permease